MPTLYNRVQENTTSTGTGNVLLAGVPSALYQSFLAAGYTDGQSLPYVIEDATNIAFEVGKGHYVASTNAIARDTVLLSSNGNALVNFQAGTKSVYVDAPKEYLPVLDLANTFTVGPQTFIPDSDAHVAVQIQQHSATQSANLLNVLKADGTTKLLRIDATGNLFFVDPNAQIDLSSCTNTAGCINLPSIADASTSSPGFIMSGGRSLLGMTSAARVLLNAPGLPGGRFDFITGGNANSTVLASILNTGQFGLGLGAGATPNGMVHAKDTDAATNSVTTLVTWDHSSTSQGSIVAGFGVGSLFRLDTPTASTRNAAAINVLWATATDASRAGQMQLGVYDSGNTFREALRCDTDGTGANLSLWGAGSYGGGRNVTFINNAAVNPTTNPTGGGILYSTGGAGTWRGSSGTVTTFAAAGPHCSACGYDFWKIAARNDDWGSYLYECGMCGKIYKKGPASVLDRLTPAQRAELLT